MGDIGSAGAVSGTPVDGAGKPNPAPPRPFGMTDSITYGDRYNTTCNSDSIYNFL